MTGTHHLHVYVPHIIRGVPKMELPSLTVDSAVDLRKLPVVKQIARQSRPEDGQVVTHFHAKPFESGI